MGRQSLLDMGQPALDSRYDTLALRNCSMTTTRGAQPVKAAAASNPTQATLDRTGRGSFPSTHWNQFGCPGAGIFNGVRFLNQAACRLLRCGWNEAHLDRWAENLSLTAGSQHPTAPLPLVGSVRSKELRRDATSLTLISVTVAGPGSGTPMKGATLSGTLKTGRPFATR